MTALPTEWQEREDDILANSDGGAAQAPPAPEDGRGGSGTSGRTSTRYYGALPAVRRLLANVPTLMIFDDHEITDDWNLNLEWIRRTQDPAKAVPTEAKVPTALARAVLRNGLVAYAIFQAWGNTPGAVQAREPIPAPSCSRAVGPWNGGSTGTEIAAMTTAVGLPSAIGDHVAIAQPGRAGLALPPGLGRARADRARHTHAARRGQGGRGGRAARADLRAGRLRRDAARGSRRPRRCRSCS